MVRVYASWDSFDKTNYNPNGSMKHEYKRRLLAEGVSPYDIAYVEHQRILEFKKYKQREGILFETPKPPPSSRFTEHQRILEFKKYEKRESIVSETPKNLPSSSLPQKSPPLSPEQYMTLELLLKELIGPIAPILLRKTMDESQHLTTVLAALEAYLSTYLSPHQCLAFRQRVNSVLLP